MGVGGRRVLPAWELALEGRMRHNRVSFLVDNYEHERSGAVTLYAESLRIEDVSALREALNIAERRRERAARGGRGGRPPGQAPAGRLRGRVRAADRRRRTGPPPPRGAAPVPPGRARPTEHEHRAADACAAGSAAAALTHPGVQKPHCVPPLSATAF